MLIAVGVDVIDVAARIVLFPFLAWQGYVTRKHALKLPEAAGRREGVAGAGPDIRLLIVGDSSAAGVGTSHQEEALLGQVKKRLIQTNTVHWWLDAKTGASTADAYQRLLRRPAQQVDIVSVSLGVNDITGHVPLPLWLARYNKLLNLLQEKFDAQVICVNGIPKMEYFPVLPQPLRWILGQQAKRFDWYLQKLVARRPECRFVPLDFEPDPSLMSEDGYHPGPKIYAAWARKVFRAIREDVKGPGKDQGPLLH
ncbi:MAG: SGNH/GDSL hydrolase family protein [Pseudomonadota bacterium]